MRIILDHFGAHTLYMVSPGINNDVEIPSLFICLFIFVNFWLRH